MDSVIQRPIEGVVAVILAGGIGARVGLPIPKQLIPLAGRTSLEHTLAVFDSAPGIDSIIIMREENHLGEAAKLLGSGRFAKLKLVLPSGITRNDTSRAVLAAITDINAKVLFHDAVHPLVDHRILQDCIGALDSYDAVDTAIASADTIIEVNSESCISAVPRRSTLRRGQTPQAFRRGVLERAYRLAASDAKFEATDDCSVVLNYLPKTPIFVVNGSEANIKITEPVDIHIADKLFQLRGFSHPGRNISHGSLAGKSIVIFGASYGIGRDLADILSGVGAVVHSFSRTTTGTDIRRREAITTALNHAMATSGRIDHVVLTAGILHMGPLTQLPEDELAESIDTNLGAPIRIAQASHPHLKNSGGSLLFYTSSSYTRGRANYGVDSATKAAIVNLTQALADEWAADGVRVNCINPSRTSPPPCARRPSARRTPAPC
ncbi:bifunctional cytidylyltransferase/SDR family oxidoreductase [Specibacter sp. NPDC078709]|uniref:bifunctional cytidylyltransferase/SDR family oxidoreductase n=1 Tax=Specibacter sp. NPDC078709 TaxID=3154364 RepID=UPI003426F182